MTVDIGWSRQFNRAADWKGGEVSGIISREPDHRSLLSQAFARGKSPGLMLILSEPASGLEPSAPPTTRDVPNNHFAYAVQWFVFAGIAAVIFALALRSRRRN